MQESVQPFTSHTICEAPGGSGLDSVVNASLVLVDICLPILPVLNRSTLDEIIGLSADPELELREADQDSVERTIVDLRSNPEFDYFTVCIRPGVGCAEVMTSLARATRRSRLFVWKTTEGLLVAATSYLDPWYCRLCKNARQCGEVICDWPTECSAAVPLSFSGVYADVDSPSGVPAPGNGVDFTKRLPTVEFTKTFSEAGHSGDQFERTVGSVAVSPSGRYALSAGGDGRMILWDLTSHTKVGEREFSADREVCGGDWTKVGPVVFAPDGRHCLLNSSYGHSRAFSLKPARDLWKLRLSCSPSTYSSDSKHLVCGGYNISVIDALTGETRSQFSQRASMVVPTTDLNVYWFAAGLHCASYAFPLDIRNGNVGRQVSLDFECRGLAVSPNGRMLVAVGMNSRNRIYGQAFRIARSTTDSSNPHFDAQLAWQATYKNMDGGVVFIGDGQYLACWGGWEFSVFDSATGGLLSAIECSSSIRSVAISKNGTTVVIGGYDGSVSCYRLRIE